MFESRLNRGKANGYAPLDTGSKVPLEYLPPIQSTIDTGSFVTTSQTGSFATTGSNQFNGNQSISGSLTVTSTVVNNSNLQLTGSDLIIDNGNLYVSGGMYVSGSVTVSSTYINTANLQLTGSDVIIDSGSIYLSGSSSIIFEGGRIVSNLYGGGGIDLIAAPGQYVELTSNNTQSFAWIDDNGFYVGTNWDTVPYQWTFNNNGTLTAPGAINAQSFTGSLSGTSSYALTASYSPNYLSLTDGGTVSGNVNFIGTASFAYVTESIVQVGASTIILNTNNPATRFGGITVVDSGSFGNSSTGSLLWDSLNNRWIYSNPSGSSYDGGMLISGPRNTSGIGNEAGMDANYLAVGAGGDHIQPSTIYNSGSGATAITRVTGSLSVSNGITGSLFGSASYADTVGESDIDYLMLQSFRLTYNY